MDRPVSKSKNTISRYSPFQANKKDGAIMAGNFNYDKRRAAIGARFEDVQARTFNAWDLQNIWSPSPSGGNCPFYVQSNVQESLLRGYDRLKETSYVDRRVLFFSREAFEFWECLFSLETSFLSDGRAESEYICHYITATDCHLESRVPSLPYL